VANREEVQFDRRRFGSEWNCAATSASSWRDRKMMHHRRSRPTQMQHEPSTDDCNAEFADMDGY